MAAADPDDLLAAGSAALAAGQWAGATAAFEDALAREPTAEAHAGLADVLWWVGESQAHIGLALMIPSVLPQSLKLF